MENKRVNQAFYRLGIFFLPLLIFIWIYVVHSGSELLKAVPACFYYSHFGIYCPGCGGTRAVYLFFHGHVIESIYYNAFIPYSFTIYVLYMVYYFVKTHFFREKPGEIPILPFIYAGIVILLLQCVMKNFLL